MDLLMRIIRDLSFHTAG